VNKREGERIAPDELCALIDTTDLALHMRELEAGLAELSSTIAAKSAEIEALEAEVRGVAREYGRIGELAEKGSVPAQRKDDLGTKLQAANLKLKAARHMRTSLVQRKRGLNVKQSMVRKQLDDCYLRAPSAGIVITRYKNAGELAAPGTAVLEIGHFDTMYVDFFVPQPLMSQLSYGQNVRIRVDSGDGAIFLPAIITWLSDEAEFTPQNVQTRESRNELVFRVRARAANAGGVLKRGMPVEVWREAAS
jgi:HlyD family secretion protein